MTKIKNLTPHTINILTEGTLSEGYNAGIVIPPSGQVARVSTSSTLVEEIPAAVLSQGIPIFETSYGEVTGLPDSEEGVYFIVSTMVAQAAPDRDDLFCPGELVRDKNGKPTGCKGLRRVR